MRGGEARPQTPRSGFYLEEDTPNPSQLVVEVLRNGITLSRCSKFPGRSARVRLIEIKRRQKSASIELSEGDLEIFSRLLEKANRVLRTGDFGGLIEISQRDSISVQKFLEAVRIGERSVDSELLSVIERGRDRVSLEISIRCLVSLRDILNEMRHGMTSSTHLSTAEKNKTESFIRCLNRILIEPILQGSVEVKISQKELEIGKELGGLLPSMLHSIDRKDCETNEFMVCGSKHRLRVSLCPYWRQRHYCLARLQLESLADSEVVGTSEFCAVRLANLARIAAYISLILDEEIDYLTEEEHGVAIQVPKDEILFFGILPRADRSPLGEYDFLLRTKISTAPSISETISEEQLLLLISELKRFLSALPRVSTPKQ